MTRALATKALQILQFILGAKKICDNRFADFEAPKAASRFGLFVKIDFSRHPTVFIGGGAQKLVALQQILAEINAHLDLENLPIRFTELKKVQDNRWRELKVVVIGEDKARPPKSVYEIGLAREAWQRLADELNARAEGMSAKAEMKTA